MSAEDYGHELMKLAIARACVALGIKQCEKSVLDSLADVMRTYIETIGRYSQEQAEISHRVCPGIQDVIPVLEYTVMKHAIVIMKHVLYHSHVVTVTEFDDGTMLHSLSIETQTSPLEEAAIVCL